MIWYLLYPLRGTTEAPILGPHHPLRVAFTRWARFAAQHVVTTLLISVAVATALLYPIPFLYSSDFTNGASNLPHHVWTNAQPLGNGLVAEPDVIMRSIWVHGSYMKALDREVLLGALELQDELLGPTKDFSPRQPTNIIELEDPMADLAPKARDTFHVINGLTNQSWFFHSPLQYWSGDYDRIVADPDIAGTVNERKRQHTSVNITLRHSVVFSGKRFEDRVLLAADALVITLIHLRDSPIGRQWERKAPELASRMTDKWTAYPRDGRSLSSQLYEFQFLPISFRDSVLLGVAYSLTCIYFMLSLSKLRAIKSKPGLILTVVVQIFASIMSSFTMCAIFKIDLSRMPRASYPIVVVSMSLENMFRLINAVIATRSEDNTTNRIGDAFGKTTHIALASVLQYLLILQALSNIVPFEPISAFCAFAGIATIFDFFYLSTFFLAVLSAEVRRTELSEAIEKSSSKLKQSRSTAQAQTRQSWTDAVFQGKTDVSTRIAGIIVMVGTVLIAQWHFFDDEGLFRTIRKLTSMAWTANELATKKSSQQLVEVHQARSPTSWLRLQDHETAREVIHVIKPLAHSYVARVYEPLVFVLKGSDRTPPAGEPSLLPAVYDFIRNQSKPFLVTVLVIVAAVRILMGYLLWDETAETTDDDNPEDEPFLSVKTLKRAHALDVAMMAASTDGKVVSVALDRSIQVFHARSRDQHRDHPIPDSKDSVDIPFPILAMAIDEDSRWLAMLSSFSVLLWNLKERRRGPAMPVDLCGQKPEAFFFAAARADAALSVVIVRRNGTMVELWPQTRESTDYPICKSPLVSVVHLPPPGHSTSNAASIMTASRRNCIHRVTLEEDGWFSEEIDLPEASGNDIHMLVAIPFLSAYLIGRSRAVDLIDLGTSRIMHTFRTEQMQPRSLRYLHSTVRHLQPGSTAVAHFSIAYTSATGDCVIQSYLPREGSLIAFDGPSTSANDSCCSWSQTKETTRRIVNPGVWDTLPIGFVVGVRNKANAAEDPSPDSPVPAAGLRQRRMKAKPSPGEAPDNWEVWYLSQLDKKGECESVGLHEAEKGSYHHLLISQLGPAVKVGTSSMAIGFGNDVKVITVGHEQFGSLADVLEADNMLNLGSRRRKAMANSRSRAYSRGSRT